MTADPSTQLLVALLTLPASSLPSTLALPSVADSLSSLLAHSQPHTTPAAQHQPDDTRQLLHSVIARAAPIKGALASVSLLAHYLAAFLPSNAHLARSTAREALAANPRLAQQVRTEGIEALRLALRRACHAGNGDGDEGAVRAAGTLLALVQGARECFEPLTSAGAAAAVEAVGALVSAYGDLADDDSASSSPSLDALRLAILDTAHSLLTTVSTTLSSTSSASPSSGALDCLRDLLVLLLPQRGSSSSSPPTPLASALASLAPALAPALADAVTGSVGPTARQVKDLVGGLRRAGSAAAEGTAPPEWLERLRRARFVGGAADGTVGVGKDGGEEVALAGVNGVEGVDAEKEAELASVRVAGRSPVLAFLTQRSDKPPRVPHVAQAISHLLDLFPHLPPPFLRAALLHPTFSPPASSAGGFERATESLVAALLDDAPLPADLVALRDGTAAPTPAPAPVQPAQVAAPPAEPARAGPTRANIHDDDRFFSRGKLLGPKNARRPPPASAAQGKGLALDESLKASIIALAEAPSSDEDDDDDYGGGAGEAFLEGEEDGGPRVRVGDGEPKDGDGSSDEEEEMDGPQGGSTTASSSAPPGRSPGAGAGAGYAPAVQLALESAYLARPELFARDGATRRGKGRRELRERTGLGDEQIEGWRSMLERDVRRVSRLSPPPPLSLSLLALTGGQEADSSLDARDAEQGKKMQRLKDKHQDLAASGNRPSAPPSHASSSDAPPHQRPPHQQQQQQQPQQGGSGARGGGGGGRGGARGGSGGASRGRGDGGRREHDRAKRGRDKKMARMGAL
ncbi:hypothetical protein DMC30DRAFT_42622 [Rhodotorula diobovata]|uniref:CUE domain-containing protein n=1 Tax=Rhodotorula diobovata TaxID=5288 RepID=A0A5C5FPC5_9BASI|nr:hypothetical protein DMC30DRAFT_42622 [Rhodotorula diobovata]